MASYGINNLIAGSLPQQYNIQALAAQMRAADASVRSAAMQKAGTAGSDATVATNLTYTTGPDGQLYATGGTVSTSRRSVGDSPSPAEVKAGQYVTPNEHRAKLQEANDSRFPSPHARPPNFAEINRPEIMLSPLEFAKLQEEGYNNDRSLEILARLRQTDIAVRSHEAQHFVVAGGLAEGTPTFELEEGSDGVFYAVGGHVDIRSTSTTDTDKAAKDASAMARAANAPADGSAQDVSVAYQSMQQGLASYSQALAAAQQPMFDLVG